MREDGSFSQEAKIPTEGHGATAVVRKPTAKAVRFGDPFADPVDVGLWVPCIGGKFTRYGYQDKALAEARRLSAKVVSQATTANSVGTPEGVKPNTGKPSSASEGVET